MIEVDCFDDLIISLYVIIKGIFMYQRRNDAGCPIHHLI